jgi:hypothetical protein
MHRGKNPIDRWDGELCYDVEFAGNVGSHRNTSIISATI